MPAFSTADKLKFLLETKLLIFVKRTPIVFRKGTRAKKTKKTKK